MINLTYLTFSTAPKSGTTVVEDREGDQGGIPASESSPAAQSSTPKKWTPKPDPNEPNDPKCPQCVKRALEEECIGGPPCDECASRKTCRKLSARQCLSSGNVKPWTPKKKKSGQGPDDDYTPPKSLRKYSAEDWRENVSRLYPGHGY
jgi:hypothetical protein